MVVFNSSASFNVLMHLFVFETLINRNIRKEGDTLTQKKITTNGAINLPNSFWQVWYTYKTHIADFLAVALFVTKEQFGGISEILLQDKLRGVFTSTDVKVKDVRVLVIVYDRIDSSTK